MAKTRVPTRETKNAAKPWEQGFGRVQRRGPQLTLRSCTGPGRRSAPYGSRRWDRQRL